MTKATVTVANVFTSAGKFFKGDVVNLPADEIKAINEIRAGALEAEKPVAKAKAPAMCAALPNGEHWQRFRGHGTASVRWL